MSREINTGEELYCYLSYLGQYQTFSRSDCDVLVRIARSRPHSFLYTTDTNLLVYDYPDGCFCVNPYSLCTRLKSSLLEEMALHPDRTGLINDIALLDGMIPSPKERKERVVSYA